MCALVANEPAKQQWLRGAGILQVLYRLTLGMQSPGDASADGDHEGDQEDINAAMAQHLSLPLRRQIARLLAILSADECALVRPSFLLHAWKHGWKRPLLVDIFIAVGMQLSCKEVS